MCFSQTLTLILIILQCADTGSLLPFIQKKPFGGSDTSPERASYVLLSSSLWALLHGLYRSHSAIPRRLLRQANNFSVELDPMLVDVHWYIGGGYASEIASDIFSVCPCGISHEKCNEVLCSISDILKRFVAAYLHISFNAIYIYYFYASILLYLE